MNVTHLMAVCNPPTMTVDLVEYYAERRGYADPLTVEQQFQLLADYRYDFVKALVERASETPPLGGYTA